MVIQQKGTNHMCVSLPLELQMQHRNTKNWTGKEEENIILDVGVRVSAQLIR